MKIGPWVFPGILAISLSAFVLLVLELTQVQKAWAQTHQRLSSERALYLAFGELELARDTIRNSRYSEDGKNLALEQALMMGGKISGSQVKVSLVDGSEGWYRLISEQGPDAQSRLVEEFVRERSSWAAHGPSWKLLAGESQFELDRYRALVDPELHFESHLQVDFTLQAEGKQQYLRVREYGVSGVAREALEQRRQITVHSKPIRRSNYDKPTRKKISVLQRDDLVALQWNPAAEENLVQEHAELIADYRMPIEDGCLILVEGHVVGLRGTLLTRLTIACARSIKINGNLRYVDSEGRSLQVLSRAGRLQSNPDADSDACLGLVSLGPISYGSLLPSICQLDANMVSQGSWIGFSSSTTKVRTSLLRNGSACALLGVRESLYRSQQLVAGFITGQVQVDVRAALAPPPYFPERWQPIFSGRQVVR